MKVKVTPISYRKPDGGGTLFAALEHHQQIGQREVGILKLRDLIDWEAFRPVLLAVTGYDKKDWNMGGRRPFDPVFMFKILVLQKFHGLSDEATEVQIRDRLSFLSFLGLRLGDEVPDANTLWDFKELIEKDGRNGSARLFAAFGEKLESEGLVAQEGSIVDASFTEAPRQRNSREENQEIKEGRRPAGFEEGTAKGRQKDREARWTQKNGDSFFGYKNHVKVDAKAKLILTGETTPAQVHDSQVFQKLVDSSDHRVLADSAYHSAENEAYLLECDAEEFLMRKSHRNHPLSEVERSVNRVVSRVRVRIEHVFARMKQLGMDWVRSIGLKRARQHNALCNLVYNLDRYAFLKKACH